jgi:hypothetical protein
LIEIRDLTAFGTIGRVGIDVNGGTACDSC